MATTVSANTDKEVGAPPITSPSVSGKALVVLREAKNARVIEPAFDFIYLDPAHPVLQELRRREKLDEVIAPAKTEFEKILLVKRWVGLQWKFGHPDPYPPWNALTILDWVRSGKIRGFCGQYAQVFLQSLLSLGIQARYFELGTKTNPICHWNTEVWLNDFNKWAVVDATSNPDLSCHFERDGIPQNALELHNAYLDGQASTIKQIQDPVVLEFIGEEPKPFSLECYYNFRICMNQNQLDFPPKFVDMNTTWERYGDGVEWEDERTILWESNPGQAWWPMRRLTARRANRPEQLYWTMHNGVEMQLRWWDGNVYVLYLKQYSPAFDSFLVRFDGGPSTKLGVVSLSNHDWSPAPATSTYIMTPGGHKIEARTKAKDGSLGPMSYLDFESPKK